MKFFDISEFACKCGCGGNEAKVALMLMLDSARGKSNTPFRITSGYRCPDHNRTVGGVDGSAHVRGYAADIRVDNNIARYTILKCLLDAGFKRIGMYDTFIHADVDGRKPQCVMWKKNG